MWANRKMERVKWTGKLTNAEVLNVINQTPKQLTEIKKRKKCIGHVLRHQYLSIIVLEGKMVGRYPKERKK